MLVRLLVRLVGTFIDWEALLTHGLKRGLVFSNADAECLASPK